MKNFIIKGVRGALSPSSQASQSLLGSLQGIIHALLSLDSYNTIRFDAWGAQSERSAPCGEAHKITQYTCPSFIEMIKKHLVGMIRNKLTPTLYAHKIP